MMDELKLIKFVKENNFDITHWVDTYVNLFNKMGEETDNEKLQLGLTALMFSQCLKQTSCPKRQKQQCLANIKVD